MEEEIIKRISQTYAPLSAACQQELLAQVKVSAYEKGTILVREGQYSDKSFFILQGCARAFYLKDGRDISDWFAFENEFVSAIVSFFTNQPSPHYIEVLEDVVLIELTRPLVDDLASKYHDFEHLIRVVVTQTMLAQRERISSILFRTAEERYLLLLGIRPDIINRVPLTHIASYLGITLETLSRIRHPRKRI